MSVFVRNGVRRGRFFRERNGFGSFSGRRTAHRRTPESSAFKRIGRQLNASPTLVFVYRLPVRVHARQPQVPERLKNKGAVGMTVGGVRQRGQSHAVANAGVREILLRERTQHLSRSDFEKD